MSPDHKLKLTELGIDEQIIDPAFPDDVEEELFNTLLHGLKLLLLPKEGKGQKEPVRIIAGWQLQALSGRLTELPERATLPARKNSEGLLIEGDSVDLADWKDNRGLTIAHYVALSGNADALQFIMDVFPSTIERASYSITGNVEHLKQISKYYDELTAKKEGENVVSLTGLDEYQSETLPQVYQNLVVTTEKEPQLRKDRQQKTIAHYAALSLNDDGIKYLLNKQTTLTKRMWTRDLYHAKPKKDVLEVVFAEAMQRVTDGSQTDDDINLLIAFDSEVPFEPKGQTTLARIAAEAENFEFLDALIEHAPQLLEPEEEYEEEEEDEYGDNETVRKKIKKTIIDYALQANKPLVINHLLQKVPGLVYPWFNVENRGEEDRKRLNQIRRKAISDAKHRLEAGKADDADVDLLIALNERKKNKLRQNIAHLAALGGDAKLFERLLRNAPIFMKKLWVADQNGCTPQDLGAKKMIPNPLSILIRLLNEVTEKMRDGEALTAKDVELMFAFKARWHELIARENKLGIGKNIATIDSSDLTRSKLLHLVMFAKPQATTGLFSPKAIKQTICLARLEIFIARLDAETLNQEQIRCLKVIVDDYERGLFGLQDPETSSVIAKIKGSKYLQSFKSNVPAKRGDKELDLDQEAPIDYQERLRIFRDNIDNLPSSPERTYVYDTFCKGLEYYVNNQSVIASELADFGKSARGPYDDRLLDLRADGRLCIHLNNINLQLTHIPDLDERSKLIVNNTLLGFFDAADAAHDQEKMADFCQSLSGSYCFEGKTAEIVGKYGGYSRGRKVVPFFDNLMELYIVSEYIPYVTMMSDPSTKDHDFIEPATDFILARHQNVECQVDNDFAPNGKVEREGIEKYLREKRFYEPVADVDTPHDKDTAKARKKTIDGIEAQINLLTKEATYYMNYFYQSRKRMKIAVLAELKRRIVEDNISPKDAAVTIKEEFPGACSGFFSTRTKRLLDDLEYGKKLKL